MILKYSKESVSDIKRIWDFLNKHDRQIANNIVQRLKASILILLETPAIGKVIEERIQTRGIVFGKYFILYQYDKKELIIIRVWHGKENKETVYLK